MSGCAGARARSRGAADGSMQVDRISHGRSVIASLPRRAAHLAKRMHVARGVEGEVGAGGRCMRLAREGQEREGGREEGRRSRRFIGIPFLGSASTGGRRCFSR